MATYTIITFLDMFLVPFITEAVRAFVAMAVVAQIGWRLNKTWVCDPSLGFNAIPRNTWLSGIPSKQNRSHHQATFLVQAPTG
jgi:hypothetical protein